MKDRKNFISRNDEEIGKSNSNKCTEKYFQIGNIFKMELYIEMTIKLFHNKSMVT